MAGLGVAFLLGVALVLLFLVLLAPAAALVAERFLVAEEAVPLLGVLALACFFSFRFSAHSLALRSASALLSALSARLCAAWAWAGVNFFLEDGVAFFLEAGVAFFLAGDGVAVALVAAGEALGLRAGVLAAVGFFPDAAFLVAEAEIRTFLLPLRLAGAGVLLRPRLLVLGVLALAGVLLRLRPRLPPGVALAGVLLRLRPRGVLLRLSDSPPPSDLLSRERVRPATVALRVPTICLPLLCCDVI